MYQNSQVHRYLKSIKFIFLLLITLNQNVFAVPIIWVGSGSGAGTSDFNLASNWFPSLPTASDDVTITFVNDGTITLSANATIKSLKLTIEGNNHTGTLDVNSFKLTINELTSVDIPLKPNKSYLYLGVNNTTAAGTIDFGGDAIFGLTNSVKTSGVYLNGNANSSLIFRSNVTLGLNTGTVPLNEPGNLIFDGAVAQKYTLNDTNYTCNFRNLIVGSINNPTVTLAGIKSPDNILRNLTVNGSSILDLNTRQLNCDSNVGTFLLKGTSQLKLGANKSTANGGSATLISGSNFPSGFTTITLDSTSTVEFNDSTAQSIPGYLDSVKSYGNLTLTNANIKTLKNNISIFRNLSLGASDTLALAGFDATLKSNKITTAYVSSIPTTASITYGAGRFVVERYLQAYQSWRLLATPIEIGSLPTIAESWRENNSAFVSTGYGTQITGPLGPIIPSPTSIFDVYTQRISIKSYDANTDNYIPVTNSNTTPIANLTGYYVFVRGDRSVGISGSTGTTILRMRGKLRTGDQVFSVPVNKFQSFGNPFASRIDFRTIYNSSISPSYYVWNPNPAGSFYGAGKYEVYSLDLGDGQYKLNGTGTIKNYIESGQAVFIQSISGGSITVKELDKFGGSSLVSRGTATSRLGVTVPTLEINLFVKDANANTVLADAGVINFDNNYSDGVDNMDVRKISNASDNLSIIVGARNLVVNRRKPLNAADTIFLSLSNTRIGPYRFNIDPSVLSNLNLKAYLQDKFLQTESPVSLSETTDINFDITNDPNSKVADRFMIVFKKFLPLRFTAITAVRKSDKSINLTWNTENENNIDNYKIERSIDGVNFIEIGSQMPTANNFGNPYYTFYDAKASKEIIYYRIKGNGITGNSIYSNTAKVLALEENNNKQVNIFPNPVTNGNININFEGAVFGNYLITINDFTGQLIKSETFRHQVTGESCIIKISNAGGGFYTANIVDETGIKKMIPFLIK